MFDWGTIPVLESKPGTASGAWVFKGTRVPVRALISILRRTTVEEFCRKFPPVTQEQAETVLLYLSESLIEDVADTPTRQSH